MTVVEATRTRILQVSDVTALIAARAYALVFPPRPTWPAVRLQQIDRLETLQLRGRDRLCRARVQVDTVAAESNSTDAYATAHAIAGAIRGRFALGVATGLVGWHGVIAGTPPFVVTGIQLIDERDGYEADELRQVLVSQDYFVNFQSN